MSTSERALSVSKVSIFLLDLQELGNNSNDGAQEINWQSEDPEGCLSLSNNPGQGNMIVPGHGAATFCRQKVCGGMGKSSEAKQQGRFHVFAPAIFTSKPDRIY